MFVYYYRHYLQKLRLDWNKRLSSHEILTFRLFMFGFFQNFMCNFLHFFLACFLPFFFLLFLYQDYFDDLAEYLRIGPPLYFVVKDYNYRYLSIIFYLPVSIM